MDNKSTHLLIIDDHQLIIDGLENVLQHLSENIEITHSQNAKDALDWLIDGKEFDLILVDISMPNMDGFSFITAINDHKIIIPIAIISATENVNDVQKALDKGALGFISKSSKSEELLNAIESILDGNIYTPFWYQPLDNNSDDPRLDLAKILGLSRRQLDVLDLLATGNSNKQIANTLFLSEDTVKSHVKALFNNFDVNNRTECINAARRHGII
jgi:DNA-binding NarL/FixJ family response regulator